MKEIKLSEIENAIIEKNNEKVIIDNCLTSEISVNIDTLHKPEAIVYIIAAIITNDYKYIDLINFETIDCVSAHQVELLREFLSKSEFGLIENKSKRKDLLQFNIKVANNIEYEIEVHLGNCNYCVCENYDIVAIDALK